MKKTNSYALGAGLVALIGLGLSYSCGELESGTSRRGLGMDGGTASVDASLSTDGGTPNGGALHCPLCNQVQDGGIFDPGPTIEPEDFECHPKDTPIPNSFKACTGNNGGYCESKYSRGAWEATSPLNVKVGPYSSKDITKKICTAVKGTCSAAKVIASKLPVVDEALDIMEWVYNSSRPRNCSCARWAYWCMDTYGEQVIENVHLCLSSGNPPTCTNHQMCVGHKNNNTNVKVPGNPKKVIDQWHGTGCSIKPLNQCPPNVRPTCDSNDIGCIVCYPDQDQDGNVDNTPVVGACYNPNEYNFGWVTSSAELCEAFCDRPEFCPY